MQPPDPLPAPKILWRGEEIQRLHFLLALVEECGAALARRGRQALGVITPTQRAFEPPPRQSWAKSRRPSQHPGVLFGQCRN
jgi:hypothetical protein